MRHVHDYGLKQIGIGLGIIAIILVLAGCDNKEPEPDLEIEEIVVTPEEPKDEGNYTEDGRKLPTLKKKYQ